MTNLPVKAAARIREQQVFNHMIQPEYWNKLTKAEQENAIFNIRQYGGDSRGMVPRGDQ